MNTAGSFRPAVARVDLAAVRHNVSLLKGMTPQGCRFMAVVKADAYGHGDLQVSRAALSAGADCLGVALLEEAVRLREAGFDCGVNLLFETPPGAAAVAVEQGVTCSVYTEEYARALSDAAGILGRDALVHLKVDSGMHRVGVPADYAGSFAAMLAGLPGLVVEGVYTHFASASEPADPFTDLQMDRFEEAAGAAETAVGHPLVRHAANSAGVIAFPRSHYEMVRVGISMLGLPPAPGFPGSDALRPALSLVGEVAFVKKVGAGEGLCYGLTYAPRRDTFIATVPLGYADGYSRLLSNRAQVLIEGRRRPVVGVVAMDVFLVELGDEPVEVGTPVTMIGSDGSEEVTVDELAGIIGTINYEVVCMISARVPRVYAGDEEGEA
ncbi:MAG: alanine racemase [Actinobacteria bacterium]|nr:alanine racemase [Actinomycetota bacterium]MBU2686059.1 alanine racemase [Actinomycetota bacterium]